MKKSVVTVQNAEGEPETTAEIFVQNKIDYVPKVSVIIPVYNVEKYLRECLDSVIGQTLREIEIICVDDGSTDSSLDILKEYAAKDERITLLTQKNSGAGKARNKGLDAAQGKFVAFMDPDDFYPAHDTLNAMCLAAKENNVLACGGDVKFFRNNQYIEADDNDDFSYPHTGMTKYEELQSDYGYWRFIFDRKFLKENNLYFPDYLRGQDPPFFVKTMCLAEKFYVLNIPTYIYRVSYKGIQWNSRKVYDYLQSQRDVLQLAQQYQLDDLFHKIIARSQQNWWINLLDKYNNISQISALRNEMAKKYKGFGHRLRCTKKYKLFGFIPLLSIEEK